MLNGKKVSLVPCDKCSTHKKQFEKYKMRYELAKSSLTKEEREILIGLLAHEQLKHLIPKGKYDTEEYALLEKLKTKIRVI